MIKKLKMISIVPLVNMKYKDKITLHFNGKKQVVPMRKLLLTIEVYSKKIKYKIKKILARQNNKEEDYIE